MNFETILKDLEGKGEAELKNLHADALVAEAQAKKDLYLVRQRIQMLGSSVETEEEKWVVDAKAIVVDAQTYLNALEVKLGVRPAPVVATPAVEPVAAPAEVTSEEASN